MRFKVVAYDFGTKLNILRLLAEQGCEITVVPAQTPAADVLAMQPDGVFLSNGPGDPAASAYAIEATRMFLDAKIRSDERRVGKECVSTCRSRWSPNHEKKKNTK